MTQTNKKLTLPPNARFAYPLWKGCTLIRCVDPTGLVREWYMVETGRWDAPDSVRWVGEAYALSLTWDYPQPDPGNQCPTTASGSIG